MVNYYQWLLVPPADARRVIEDSLGRIDARRRYVTGYPLGTDAAVALMYPGFSLRDELGYFVDMIGMTPLEALRSATRLAAEFSGVADSLGTVEVGKVADVVLLDADPLVDIRHVGRIRAVIMGGRLFDRSRLDELLSAAMR
jgi:imidazolonepropionase-like amidohydrolase